MRTPPRELIPPVLLEVLEAIRDLPVHSPGRFSFFKKLCYHLDDKQRESYARDNRPHSLSEANWRIWESCLDYAESLRAAERSEDRTISEAYHREAELIISNLHEETKTESPDLQRRLAKQLQLITEEKGNLDSEKIVRQRGGAVSTAPKNNPLILEIYLHQKESFDEYRKAHPEENRKFRPFVDPKDPGPFVRYISKRTIVGTILLNSYLRSQEHPTRAQIKRWYSNNWEKSFGPLSPSKLTEALQFYGLKSPPNSEEPWDFIKQSRRGRKPKS